MDHINDLVQQIAHYFNLDMTETHKKRLRYFCEEYEKKIPEKVRIQKVHQVLAIKKPVRFLESIAIDICEEHQMTMEQLKMDSPSEAYSNGRKRLREYVDGRQEFCLRAFEAGHSKTAIAKFLKMDHTSVIHLVHHRKSANPFV